ncbi:MAG: hypothetical protein AAF648_16925 [Pseudomonadota bacterium]
MTDDALARRQNGRGTYRPVQYEMRNGVRWLVVVNCAHGREVCSFPEALWDQHFGQDAGAAIECVWIQEIARDLDDLAWRIRDAVAVVDIEDHVRLLRRFVELRQQREVLH